MICSSGSIVSENVRYNVGRDGLLNGVGYINIRRRRRKNVVVV